MSSIHLRTYCLPSSFNSLSLSQRRPTQWNGLYLSGTLESFIISPYFSNCQVGFSCLLNRPHTHKDGVPLSFPSINIRNRRLCANKYLLRRSAADMWFCTLMTTERSNSMTVQSLIERSTL